MTATATAPAPDTTVVAQTLPDILSFDPKRRTNAHAIVDAARLGWIDGSVLDLTLGWGKFWSDYRPPGLITNDLHQGNPDHRIDFTDYRRVLTEIGQVDTSVLDADYRLNGTPDRGERDVRYGTDLDKTANERMDDILDGVTSACLASRRHVLVKLQDQVSSGYMHRQMDRVAARALTLGFRWEDELYVLHNAPPQRSQKRARHNVSALMYLRKGGQRRWSWPPAS